MSMPSLMQQFDSLRLMMVSGKGGVGKTTLACAWARNLAQQFPDQQVRLLSTDPAHSLGDVLQMAVCDRPTAVTELPNLQVQALDADRLLQTFKDQYGQVLEQLVERGSFVDNDDLSPVWNLSWPGLDELMGILEIQRLLQSAEVDRIVVDMAPSGHTLNLLSLMDFLEELLSCLALFQEKHQVICQSLTGTYIPDDADEFLHQMQTELHQGRAMLQDAQQTACLVVTIAEPMGYLETRRFLTALDQLHIACGAVMVNRYLPALEAPTPDYCDRLAEQQQLLAQYLTWADRYPVVTIEQQAREPLGGLALDQVMASLHRGEVEAILPSVAQIAPSPKYLPSLPDFLAVGRRLILVGGKGGVGKTTVAAAIATGMASQYPQHKIRVISIDPAHSLGDALGQELGHRATALTANLTAQEVDADRVLDQFRADYLWELADMMSGESGEGETMLKLAYGPEAWRRIVAQALPGIDEMLSLMTVMELLEGGEQDLIILDTAPTGHLLRFLEMPTALGDWLAWIFKLWIKYQDVLGRTEFMGRLRQLRQRVIAAQKKLKDPQHTEFIGVVQNQAAILAEAERLSQTLSQMGIAQPHLVYNRYAQDQPGLADRFPRQTIVRLPILPRSLPAQQRIQQAAELLF